MKRSIGAIYSHTILAVKITPPFDLIAIEGLLSSSSLSDLTHRHF